jgi:hypothetical protein
MGSSPVPFDELKDLRPLEADIQTFGIPLKVTRAHQGFLGSGGPKEVVFEGTIGGLPMKGILDPFDGGGGFRLFLWYRDARAQTSGEELVTFKHDGAPYVVWRGKGPEGDYIEAVHFEKIGLVREFR